ncbi:MAG: hypothetical protein E7491_09570 [Ruminococcaceae bacterium]|nr:hypothetical protein [Oscillospiraceae bacterium]
MRRFVFFLITMILCTVCSCNAEKSISQLTESYRSDVIEGEVRLEYNGLAIKAELDLCGNSFAVKVTQPEELAGMRITRTDGQITLEYLGMSVPFTSGEKLPVAQLVCVFDALREGAQESFTVTKHGEGYSVSYGGGIPFTAELDENGMLKSAVFTAREQRINAIFENMAVTEDNTV